MRLYCRLCVIQAGAAGAALGTTITLALWLASLHRWATMPALFPMLTAALAAIILIGHHSPRLH